jgi:hypothetical protein
MFGIPLAAMFPTSEIARPALSILHHHHESPRTTGRRPVRSLTAAAPVIQNIFPHLRRVAVRCSTPTTTARRASALADRAASGDP